MTGERELYDLRKDRWELQNVVAGRPAIARELLARTKALCAPPPPGYAW